MSGMPEFKTVVKDVSAQMRRLRETQPDLMAAFSQLAAAGTKEGALSKKTREMIALGIAVAGRCDDCIGFHIQALIKLGTTRTELEEVLGTAVYMGGGPSMMYATHALAAFDEFSS
ncbi:MULTISPECIES: carboxymuconolactone decarboxylase family protein [Cupriavidus]|uniref:Alkylhydroperoxidase AhpD core n=1 Tax=Cupriavidus pinatubonensis (strain JMP 134 / LMG 1197) TaxID=264198 RepID=Q472X2_CUPPJ|nr:carboxymuconolactone decarboxylase family protein [Cupriavidus pinatubonensis]QYY33365.1 carboxymuconolactone decarboxylase family protein [Cupriavidus pinatubonensis]TPQ31722.1 carboxymuconolactone decarboxylase family protein [Cupriavidus pinatubonensis]